MKKNSQILIGVIAGLLILLFLGIVILAASLIFTKKGAASPTPMAVPTVVVEIPPAPTPTQNPQILTPAPTPSPISKKTSRPKPTATKAPKPKATATKETKPKAVVTAQKANLRTGPGTGYEIVTQAPKGTEFTIVARDESGNWLGVLLESGEIGWIYKDLTRIEGDASEVPILLPPKPGGKTPQPTSKPTATATKAPARIAGKLAFPVFDPARGTYDVYVLNMSNKSAQRVIDYASEPALSPDGNRIAFRRWKSDNRGLEVMDTYGGNRRRLTNFFEDALPSWSPDAKTLVFFSRRESDRGSRIYMLDINGAHDWVLRRGANVVFGEYPTWGPSGHVIYRATVPQAGIGMMNNDGSGFRMLVADGSATAPAVSPDGKKIAFMSTRDGNWEIYVATFYDSGLRLSRLTNNPANDGLPAWSPDGNTIAFLSDRSGHWSIWLMNPDGTDQREFYTLPGSPDGHVRGEPDYASRGWVEERISWSR